jgi:hypothetical protein
LIETRGPTLGKCSFTPSPWTSLYFHRTYLPPAVETQRLSWRTEELGTFDDFGPPTSRMVNLFAHIEWLGNVLASADSSTDDNTDDEVTEDFPAGGLPRTEISSEFSARDLNPIDPLPAWIWEAPDLRPGSQRYSDRRASVMVPVRSGGLGTAPTELSRLGNQGVATSLVAIIPRTQKGSARGL